MRYIAPSHTQEEKIYELKEQWDGTNGIGIRRKLNALIKEAPDLIEAYNFRHDILQLEDHLVAMDKEAKRAYQAVITNYFSDEQFPESMEWGFLENRPILRALYNYAVSCWHPQDKDKAVELFEKLLKMNPNDNQGVRFCLLALYEGMWKKQFFDDMDESERLVWFQGNHDKYPKLKGYEG